MVCCFLPLALTMFCFLITPRTSIQKDQPTRPPAHPPTRPHTHRVQPGHLGRRPSVDVSRVVGGEGSAENILQPEMEIDGTRFFELKLKTVESIYLQFHHSIFGLPHGSGMVVF